jgi:hypothetical protein
MAIFEEISSFLEADRRSRSDADAATRRSQVPPRAGDWIRQVRHRNGRVIADARWHLHDGKRTRTLIGWEMGTACGRRLAIVRWSSTDDGVVEHAGSVDDGACGACRAAIQAGGGGLTRAS